MQTVKLTNYRAFIGAGRPYYPTLDEQGRLLLPNFSTSPDAYNIKNAKRLDIRSGVIYNRGSLCAAYVTCASCCGFRWRWLYWRAGRQVTWHDLTWDERRTILTAYAKQRANLPIFYAPIKSWRKWVQ